MIYKKSFKPLRLSASMMTTYKGCPMAYFLKYKEHVNVPSGINLAFGKVIHEMLEQFYKKNYKSAESFANAFKFQWFRCCSGEGLKGKDKESLAVTEYSSGTKDGKEYVLRLGNHIKIPVFGNVTAPDIFWGYKSLGERMLRHFYETYKGKTTPAIREGRYELDIEGHPDIHGIKRKHHAIVIFDRIDIFKDSQGRWRCTIGDYKTDKGDPKDKSFDIHRHPQFSLYSLAFRQLIKEGRLKGIIPDEIKEEDAILYFHLRNEQIAPTYRSESDFDYVRSILDDVSWGILNKRFTPFYGFHCRMCDYKQPCEEYSHSHGGPRIDLEGKIKNVKVFDWNEDFQRFLKEGPEKYNYAAPLYGQMELPFEDKLSLTEIGGMPDNQKPKKIKIGQKRFKFKPMSS
jgi:RecB family exonuclease